MNDAHDNAADDKAMLEKLKPESLKKFEEWYDKYTDEHGFPYAQGNEMRDAFQGGWDLAMNLIEETEGKLCQACGVRNPMDEWLGIGSFFGGAGNCPNCGGNG